MKRSDIIIHSHKIDIRGCVGDWWIFTIHDFTFGIHKILGIINNFEIYVWRRKWLKMTPNSLLSNSDFQALTQSKGIAFAEICVKIDNSLLYL
jgi:hypothetical protein